MKIKIYSATNEMDATLTKGYLQSFGIDSTSAPGNDSLNLSPQVNKGPNTSFDLFVEESDAEEVKNILGDRGVINN